MEEVLIDFVVLHPWVRCHPTRGNLPHGDAKCPLPAQKEKAKAEGTLPGGMNGMKLLMGKGHCLASKGQRAEL